jgi:acetolactate decarboxylase
MAITLTLNLPDALEEAVSVYCAQSGDSPERAVLRALAEFLDLEHHVVYQVSTSGALVEGVLQGATRLREVLKHGDFGLGTFHGLDGEGILLDGQCWQALGNGTVRPVDVDQMTPFWVATRFQSEVDVTLTNIQDIDSLYAKIDALRTSNNIFTGIRIDGAFTKMDFRVACKSENGTDLVSATHHQAEFYLEQVEGTLVGFYTPEYAHTIGVPGYHLHFISHDRTQGGHVLGLAADTLKVSLDFGNELKLILPESASFLNANLTNDPREALELAEKARD